MNASKLTPQSVADYLNRVGGWHTRQDIARAFNRPYSTHVLAIIEAAVDRKLIYKTFGSSSSNRPAWVYAGYSFVETLSDNR